MASSPIRIGLMGFGRIGRQIYQLAAADDAFEIVAISDIGRPQILHHLLTRENADSRDVRLEGNYLVGPRSSARLLSADRPGEVPWDVFGVDVVIDATGRHRSRAALAPHLDGGARRVIVATLPEGEIDRVIVCGVNEGDVNRHDRIVSAGSATTTALAIALKVITDRFPIDHASMTSVHAYTSDQSLQDYAGPDYRRSRSGAENIIPNSSQSPEWVERVLPAVAGKLSGYTLNVPVRVGSLLDLNVAFADSSVDTDAVNALMIEAANAHPRLLDVTADPIVSSDVKGCDKSALYDLSATIKAGKRLVKSLIWYETLGHARRLLDVAQRYAVADAGGG